MLKKSKLNGSSSSLSWDQCSLFRISDEFEYPWLLLDDPVGLLLKLNLIIDYLRRQLVSVVNELSGTKSIEMRTALLAYQLFYRLRANHIESVSDPGMVSDSMSDKAKERAKNYERIVQVREYLSKTKLEYYLHKNKRDMLKRLILYFQSQASKLYDAFNDSKSPWGNNLEQVFIDRFAQKGDRYAVAFNELSGLFDLWCFDPNDIDSEFDTECLPPNKLIPEITYNISYMVPEVPPMPVITGYTEVIYEKHNFQVLEKTYRYIGDSLSPTSGQKPTVKVYKELDPPPGYAFIHKLLTSTTLGRIVFPDVSVKEPESQSACHQFYLKASGRYSPVQLNQLSTPEDVSLNEPVLDSTLLLSPLHKAEKRFLRKV